MCYWNRAKHEWMLWGFSQIYRIYRICAMKQNEKSSIGRQIPFVKMSKSLLLFSLVSISNDSLSFSNLPLLPPLSLSISPVSFSWLHLSNWVLNMNDSMRHIHIPYILLSIKLESSSNSPLSSASLPSCHRISIDRYMIKKSCTPTTKLI